MPRSYRATLTGDRLVWQDDAPAQPGESVTVRVTLLEDESKNNQISQGERMAAALAKLAALEAFIDEGDAAQWERGQRLERELPGRRLSARRQQRYYLRDTTSKRLA